MIQFFFVYQVRSANGQTVIRVERSDEDSNRQRMELHDQQLAALAHPETDDLGLPIIDCEKPAPWSTPPQKTYKQVIIFNEVWLLKDFPFFLPR